MLNILTEEQKKFAEEHHNLVWKFLNKKRLGMDFYDVVIFAYLKAVQAYLERAELHTKYKFTTIAFHQMQWAVKTEQMKQYQQKQKAIVISLNEAVQYMEGIYLGDVIGDPKKNVYAEVEDRMQCEMIFKQLTKEQAEAVKLRVKGYTNSEIAKTKLVGLRKVWLHFNESRKRIRLSGNYLDIGRW